MYMVYGEENKAQYMTTITDCGTGKDDAGWRYNVFHGGGGAWSWFLSGRASYPDPGRQPASFTRLIPHSCQWAQIYIDIYTPFINKATPQAWSLWTDGYMCDDEDDNIDAEPPPTPQSVKPVTHTFQ